MANAANIDKFTAPREAWGSALCFFLSYALLGLQFYPALLVVLMFMAYRWRTNRYDFMVELTLLLGGYGFMHPNVLPVKMADVALVLGLVSMVLCRRNDTCKRLLKWMVLYVAAVVLIARTSDESMRVQFVMMRNYFYIFYFFVPFAVFANRSFDFNKLLNSIVVHVLVICALYVVDTYLLNALCLVPAAGRWEDTNFGTIYYSSIHRIIGKFNPFSFYWPRHYPSGCYWMLWLVIPIVAKQIRFSKAQWLLIALAVLSTRTMTFMFGLAVCYVIFTGNLKRMAKYAACALVVATSLYFVDRATGGYIRLASTVDQFVALDSAMDEEDLAEFGTGRMAQIIPKWELLCDLNRQWLGFGFLHPELTTNPKYQIVNEYYVDVAKSNEVATAVEETHVQTILDIGFIGLIVQCIFYIMLYMEVKPLKLSSYYLCILVGFSLFGIGGFSGVIAREGLLMIALALAVPVLQANESDPNLSEES